MSEKTLFERIIDREISADIIYEDEVCLAFKDIAPQAPFHILVIPKKPIPRLGEASDEDQNTLGHLLLTARSIARDLGLTDKEKGFRIVINAGKDGGEPVPH